jgi:hypothetical protein
MKSTPNTSIQLLKVGDLRLGKYQRALNATWVKEKSKVFDRNLMGTILVSFRNGQYYVIDGQHRTILAKRNGINEVMALVYNGLSYEEEAKLFVLTNTQKTRVTKIDRFNGEVEAKDTDVVEMKNIIENNGFRTSKTSGKNAVSAIGEVQKIYKKYGSYHLQQTLALIRQTWNGETYSLNNIMLGGVSEFLKIYGDDPDFSIKTFAAQLSRVDPIKVVRESQSDTTTDKVYVKTMNALLKYYNKGLRAKKLENRHFSA